MAYDWYQAWLADKQKRDQQAQQDPNTGKVNFHQASMANNIQYTLPGFTGRSGTKGVTSQWEQDMLKPLKGYGRSYDDRFNNLTKRMGMSDSQAQNFRTYLDAQEASQQQYNVKKDGTPDNRHTVYAGQGMQTQNQQIDGILKNMANPNTPTNEMNAITNIAPMPVPKQASTNYQPNLYAQISAGGQRMGDQFLRTFLGNKFADQNAQDQLKTAEEDLKANPNSSAAQRNYYAAFHSIAPAQSGTEKALNNVGGFMGNLAPYMIGDGAIGIGKSALGLTEKAAPSIARLAGQGALSGAVGSGIDSAAKATIGGEQQSPWDIAKNATINAGIGAVANPLVSKVAQRIFGKLAQGKPVPQIAREEGLPEEQVHQVVNNYSNVLADKKPVMPNPIEKPLNINPKVTDSVPPNVPTKQQEIQQAENDLAHTWNTRQAMEDQHVQEHLAPFLESQQQHAAASQQWQYVKEAKDTAQNIKQSFGKIVPDGLSKDAINEIPPQFKAKAGEKGDDIYKFAEQHGFKNPDEAVQFLKQIDSATKTKLKDLTPQDGMKLNDQHIQDLTDAARKSFADTPHGQAIDSLLKDLMNAHSELTNGAKIGDRSFIGAKPQPQPNVDNLINSFKANHPEEVQAPPKQENVNNSQVNPVPTDGKKESLLKLDLQHFEDTALPRMFSSDKAIGTKTPIESINNPVLRKVHSFIENAVNSTHSAKIAHQQVLESAIKDAEGNGLAKKAEQLRSELKGVKKSGSSLEWAMANEKTAGNKTKNFLEKHIGNLQDALGSTKEKDMADALRYQFAKNIDWIWKNVNPDYEVGSGWDRSFVTRVLNDGANNPKLGDFTKAMKGLTQEWRDKSLKANLITKGQHEALSRNPYYIPMSRDVTPGMDNIDRGMANGVGGSKNRPGAYFIHKLGNGDSETMYKNPMETIVKNSHSLFKNVARSDTAKEALRLTKLDKNNTFFKEVGKQHFNPQSDIAVPTPQGTRYVRMQEDLMKMYKENDLPLDLNTLGKITSLFSGAKVRSLQYQFTGVPRDLAEGYLKGQINNPFKYAKELISAARSHNIDAKQAGAIFEHAYNDGMGGINQDKLLKEFSKQSGNVRNFNPKSAESWKELTGVIRKIADMPFKPAKFLGQMSDELPRSVEAKVTKENYMKKYGQRINNVQNKLNEVNQKLEAAKGIQDPFHPDLQGIDKLHAQKAKMETILNNHERALQREQTYRGRDIMNFSQIGRSGIAKHIKQYAAFANTGTQSKYKLLRAFIERPVATTAKAALLTAPLVYAEKVMQQNLTGTDKDLYNNTPDYIKQYNYVYVHGGKVYTLPKIQELALITDPIEALLTGDKSSLNSSARNAVKESVPYQLGNIAQGFVPGQDGKINVRQNATSPVASTFVEPAIDSIANAKVGFNHNPISYADTFGRKNPKANKWTLDLFKGIAGNKPNADYLQYLTEQFGGDAGKYLEQLLNVAKSPTDKAKIDTMIQALNPAQDRAYGNIQVAGHQVFKSPYQKSKVTKK